MSPTPDSPLLRHAPATVHGRYLVHAPAPGARERWLVGFHGYAQSAEVFLEALVRVPRDRQWRVVSVQALHPFYATRSQQVVANWMTRQDREHAIADNVAYVDTVLDQLGREFGPPVRVVFAGFSQGVAMAYRAALRGRHACDAIVACGGDVPPELANEDARGWPMVLAATGRGDDFYTPERLEQDMAIIRRHRPDARALVFEGGHEWSDALVAESGALLAVLAAREPGAA